MDQKTINSLAAYMPIDRRQAVANGRSLPYHAEEVALFADISGFTPLTGALAAELGLKQGAEMVLEYINPIFEALIAILHQYGGSVIGFAGDAITCWLDSAPEIPGAKMGMTAVAHRAISCALAMQEAMSQFSTVYTPVRTI